MFTIQALTTHTHTTLHHTVSHYHIQHLSNQTGLRILQILQTLIEFICVKSIFVY